MLSIPPDELFRSHGHKTYGERCSQLEHAVATAQRVKDTGGTDALVAAAFLHDVGHFLADIMELEGRDEYGYAGHAEIGAEYLKSMGFPAAVYEPVRAHVDAKRYEVTLNNSADHLSEASRHTLKLQGGPMPTGEMNSFRTSTYFDDAMALRRADDYGKPGESIETNLDYWLEFVLAQKK